MLSTESTNESNNLKIKSNGKENLKDHHDPDAGADGISIGSGTGV